MRRALRLALGLAGLASCGDEPTASPPARLSPREAEDLLAERRPFEGASSAAAAARASEPVNRARYIVSARLLDAGARPLAGDLAWIRLGEGGGPETLAAASSDRSGAVWLGLPELPETLLLAAGGSGTWRALFPVERARFGGREILNLGEIVLRAGSAVVGRVTDEAGQAVAGAFVGLGPTLDALGGEPESLARQAAVWPVLEDLGVGSVPPITRTDADGTFALEGVPPGRCMLVAASPGERNLLPDRETLELVAGETLRARELVLHSSTPAQRIEGRVRAPDGSPLAGAWVALERD